MDFRASINGSARTFTVIVSVKPPSVVVTVMVALPTLKAETRPLELTEAFVGLFEVQDTVLSVASAGATTAVNCCVLPSYIFIEVPSLIVTPVTSIVTEPKFS